MGLFDYFFKDTNAHKSSIKAEVDEIIETFESGDIPLLQNRLYLLCSKFNKHGGGRLITQFAEKDRLCEVFNLCLEYDWMHDSDIREVWAENAFYCIAEYFKVAETKQDCIAASLDMFLTCTYGKDDLLTKFNDILLKSRIHPVHCSNFTSDEYNGGGEYLVREFAFFSATVITPLVKQYPDIIAPENRSAYQAAVTDFEFASVSPLDIIGKMAFISSIIGSILDDM